MKLRNLILLALGFIFFQSACAEPKIIRCLYEGDSDSPTDLIFDLATGTAEVRSKNIDHIVVTYAAKVQEFPTKLRFTWQQQPLVSGISDYVKVTFDLDRSTLKASKSDVLVGGELSGYVLQSKYECTIKQMPKVKNKI